MDINLESHFLSEVSEEILYSEEVKACGKSCTLALCNSKLFLSDSKIVHSYDWQSVLGAKVVKKSKKKKILLLCFPIIENKRRFIKHSLQSADPEKLVKILQSMAFLNKMPAIYDTRYLKRFKVIINPNSGRGFSRRVWAQVSPLFESCELSISYTERRNHATEIISELELSEFDGLLIVSGDGLVHEAINALCRREDGDLARMFPISVIPAGSANALAQVVCDLSGEPVSPEICALLAIKGTQYPMDISRVNFASGQVIYSFLSVCWAFIADVDIESERCRCCGACRFDVYGFWRILALRRYAGRITWDDGEYNGPIPYFMACNAPFIGTGMNVAPRADITDGMNDIVMLEDVGRIALTRVLLRQDAGSHVSLPYLKYYKTKKWRLEPEESSRRGIYSIDGELYDVENIEVEVLHKHCTVFVLR